MQKLQSHGALRQAALYIERPADRELPERLLRGELCYVLGPRQIGKSSLRVRTEHRLREQGLLCAAIDLTRIGVGGVTLDQFYFGLVDELCHRLELGVDAQALWGESGKSTPVLRFSRFLTDTVLGATARSVVIFLDEIDTLLAAEEIRDDFFAAIRELYNQRAERSALSRLTFCLLGVASPRELSQDPRRTPFNVGHAILLEDFTRDEARAFLPSLAEISKEPERLLDEVLSWTDGHPYMTHRLCEELVERGFTIVAPAYVVEEVIKRVFIQKSLVQEANLLFADHYFSAEASGLRLAQMLGLYRRLLQGEQVAADEADPVQMALRLSGIAAERTTPSGGRVLRVRNRIFATVFDREWIKRKEADHLIETTSVSGVRAGPFVLGEKIAESESGDVYHARNEATGARVTLKLMHRHRFLETEARLRFASEVEATSAIEHENIARVIEFGQLQGGLPYLVMEPMEGELLAALLRKKERIDPQQALSIAQQIAGALSRLHERGIIHRALDAEAVMLVQDLGAPMGLRAKVFGFDLARVPLDQGDQSRTRSATPVGMRVGVPECMAPEQLRGAEVTGKADVFALGVLLHRMLTGRPPHDDAGADLMEGLRQRALGQPRALRDAAPALDAEVAALTERMLAHEPAERPAMDEVEGRLAELFAIRQMRARHSDARRAAAAPGAPAARFAAAPTLLRAAEPVHAANTPVPETPVPQLIPQDGDTGRVLTEAPAPRRGAGLRYAAAAGAGVAALAGVLAAIFTAGPPGSSGARDMSVSPETQAWRDLGRAGCVLKKTEWAEEAYRNLDVADRRDLLRSCQRYGVTRGASGFEVSAARK